MHLIVTFSNGEQFKIPQDVIAKDRADYYAMKEGHDRETYNRVYKEEIEFAKNNTEVLRDWASNSMDWEDVKHKAVKLESDNTSNKSEEWVNAEKNFRE